MHTLDLPVLVIGRDAWARTELATIGVTHMGACRRVSQLAAEIRAKSLTDFYRRFDVGSLASTPGYGLACLYVLWKAYESEGLSSRDWYMKGREGQLRTFSTIKRSEHDAAKRSKRKSGGRQE